MAAFLMAPPWMAASWKASSQEKLDAYATLTFYLLAAQASSFLIQLFPNTFRQTIFGYLPSLCGTLMTFKTPCYSIGHQVLPTQLLPTEAEDKRTQGRYFRHVPLLTCLIYFLLKGIYMEGPFYVLQSPDRTVINLSLIFNQRFKSSMC